MSDDQAIVQQVLADQPGAFERLVSQHERLVWHIVLRMVGDESDASDLAQEVFLRVFRKLAQYRFDASLSTWIGRIAYTIALRFLERRRPDIEPFDDTVTPSEQADPERALEISDAQSLVAIALATVAPVPRTIVSLYHLQGFGIDEIAEVVDLPSGTVKSHLFRARNRMRAALVREEWS